jgi:hypothetical protein
MTAEKIDTNRRLAPELHPEGGGTSLVKMIKQPKIELRPTTQEDLKMAGFFLRKLDASNLPTWLCLE